MKNFNITFMIMIIVISTMSIKLYAQQTQLFDDLYEYKAHFEDDYINGQGTYYHKSGDKIYEGEFQYGEFNGQGTYYFKSGDKYVGNFKNNKCNGQGTYYHKSGAKYVGQWEDDEINGQGTIFWNGSSDKVVGTWQNNNGYNLAYYYNEEYKGRINVIDGKPSLIEQDKSSMSQYQSESILSDLKNIVGALTLVFIGAAILSDDTSSSTSYSTSNYSSSSGSSSRGASKSNKTSDWFYVTVNNNGFLVDNEVNDYTVIIERTADLQGNPVYDNKDKQVRKTYFIGSTRIEYVGKEYGYYNVEYFGFDKLGNKLFHCAYSNIMHKCVTYATFFTDGSTPRIECN